MNTAMPVAPNSTGTSTRVMPTPLALSAVISFSAASRLNAYSVDTSTAIGSVMATVNGTESMKNSPMTPQPSPLPTRSPNRLAM